MKSEKLYQPVETNQGVQVRFKTISLSFILPQQGKILSELSYVVYH